MPEVIKQWFIKHMPVEEDIGLHENKAFIRWIAYPLLAILVVVIAVTWNLFEDGIYSFDKEFEMSFVTLNDFAKYYAFPIASLTVPLTFGVMFNRFHSSKQKAKSNRLVEVNNTANNYFSHFQHYKTYIQNIENEDNLNTVEIEIHSTPLLYKALFINSTLKNNNFDIPKIVADDFMNKLKKEVQSYKDHVEGLDNKENIFYELQFDLKFMSTKEAVVKSTSSFFKTYRSYILIYSQIFEFEGTANSDEISNYFEDSIEKCFYDFFDNGTEDYNVRDNKLIPRNMKLKGIE